MPIYVFFNVREAPLSERLLDDGLYLGRYENHLLYRDANSRITQVELDYIRNITLNRQLTKGIPTLDNIVMINRIYPHAENGQPVETK